MKKWTKRERKFLNPSKDCLAAVSWHVDFTPGKPDSEHKWNRKTWIEAELSVTDEGKAHFVTRRADLRPVRNMIKELQAFEAMCTKAFDDKEKDIG